MRVVFGQQTISMSFKGGIGLNAKEIWTDLRIEDGIIFVGERSIRTGATKQDIRREFGDVLAQTVKGTKGTAFYLSPALIGHANSAVITLGKKFFAWFFIYGEGRDFAEDGEDSSDLEAMKENARLVFEEMTLRLKKRLPDAKFKNGETLRKFFGENFTVTLEWAQEGTGVSLHVGRPSLRK